MAPGVFQSQVDFDKASGPAFQISVQVIKVPPIFYWKKNECGRETL